MVFTELPMTKMMFMANGEYGVVVPFSLLHVGSVHFAIQQSPNVFFKGFFR